MATQIAAGDANNIRVRVYGDKGGLEWQQMDPNKLIMKWLDRPTEIIHIGNNGYMSDFAVWNTRTPAGHPEGFIEAFANIYRNYALAVMDFKNGKTPDYKTLDFPNVYDGVRGMQFIETMIAAGNDNNNKWQKWID